MNSGVRARAALENKLSQQLVMVKTLEGADRMVAHLELLHAQFPSEELPEALRSTCGWRDDLSQRLGMSFTPPPTADPDISSGPCN